MLGHGQLVHELSDPSTSLILVIALAIMANLGSIQTAWFISLLFGAALTTVMMAFLLVWMVFLGLGIALAQGRHVAMSVLLDRMPPALRRSVGKVIDLVGLDYTREVLERADVALLVIDASEPWAATCTRSQEWPFFMATSAATIVHSTRATWIGPSSASSPNNTSAPAIRTTIVPMGTSASSTDGSRAAGQPPAPVSSRASGRVVIGDASTFQTYRESDVTDSVRPGHHPHRVSQRTGPRGPSQGPMPVRARSQWAVGTAGAVAEMPARRRRRGGW